MSGLKWTEEHDKVVLENYKKLTAKQIGALIGRTEQAVHLRVGKLNLRTAQRPITMGQKFGHLTVIARSERTSKHGMSYTICKCACGIEKEILSSNLNRGLTNSCGCVTRQRHGQVSYNSLYQAYKRGARDRNYEFNLDMPLFISITSKNCHYCNTAPKPYNHYLRKRSNEVRALTETFEEAWINVNGIDRADNNQGYTVENCVPCCTRCNKAKLDMSMEEFKSWIKKVHAYLLEK